MLGVSQAAIEILNGGEHAIKASQIDAGLGYQCSEGCAVYRKKSVISQLRVAALQAQNRPEASGY